MCLRLYVSCILLVLLQVSQSNASKIRPEDGDEIFFGQGYDSTKGQLASNCLTEESRKPKEVTEGDTKRGAQKVEALYAEVSDLRMLSSTLFVDSSFSARFGIGSASGAAEYFRSTSFNSYNFNLMIRVDVSNVTQALLAPQLQRKYLDLARSNPTRFMKVCGDEFVVGKTMGGQFLAILEIETKSQHDRDAFRAKLGGGYLTNQAATDLQKSIQEIQQSNRITLRILRHGSSGAIPSIAPGEIAAYALKFPDLVSNEIQNGRPWVILAKTRSYESIDDKAGLPDMSPNKLVLQWMAEDYDRGLEMRNNFHYAARNRKEFFIDDEAGLRTVIDELEAYLIDLTAAAHACVNKMKTNIAAKCDRWQKKMPIHSGPKRRVLIKKDFNMKRVFSFQLPPDYTCRLMRTSGVWSRSGPPTLTCSPPNLTYSYDEATGVFGSGEFDAIKFDDNEGVCSFEFECRSRY